MIRSRKRHKGIGGRVNRKRKEIIKRLVDTLPLPPPVAPSAPPLPPSAPPLPLVAYSGPLTSVPLSSHDTVASVPTDTINAIPTVPPLVDELSASTDTIVTQCAALTFNIEPRKQAVCIYGISDELLRQFQKRILAIGLDRSNTLLLAGMVSSLYIRNGNLKSYRKLAEKCETELLHRFSTGPIETPLGTIRPTRGDETHDTWSLLHCFARCAQCKRHTSLSSPMLANNGNVRMIHFFTRKCGCALRYCPSCVENYYVDSRTRSVKDVICWMCHSNQEYGFRQWNVKVPYQTICGVNEETVQHASCLFEPCAECKRNTRPTESYVDDELLDQLKKFNGYLSLARNSFRAIIEKHDNRCTFCDQETTAGDKWTFEGCGCTKRSVYHTRCAKTLATHFESTCPLCAQKGFYKL